MAKLSDGPFFKFYPAKFMKGVRGLTASEVGVYIMLLCRIYEEDGPLEFNPLVLSTYCEMRQTAFEKTAERLIALGKLRLSDGMLFNDKAEEVISDRAVRVENAKRAGEISAQKRQTNQRDQPTDVQPPSNYKNRIDKSSTPLPPKGEQLDLIPEVKEPKKKSQFPPDWTPSEKLILWAMDQGLDRGRAYRCGEAARDYHRSKGNTFLNHDLAYHTWVRNEIGRNGPTSGLSPGSGPKPGGDDAFMRRLNQRIGGAQ